MEALRINKSFHKDLPPTMMHKFFPQFSINKTMLGNLIKLGNQISFHNQIKELIKKSLLKIMIINKNHHIIIN